jgi:tagaturonate reductase
MNLNEVAGLTDAVTAYLIDIEKLGMKEAVNKLL